MKNYNTEIKSPDTDVMQQAASLLRAGEIVGFPTETVYGLGADAKNAQAVRRIFLAKGRPQDNPLIVHIAQMQDMYLYGEQINEKTRLLAKKFWPGPLTLVVKSAPCIAKEVTCGLDTVGLRCPENEIARALIAACGLPIAAPSANRSGRPSPTTAQHVFEDMSGKIPLILDGGPCSVGVESTVISMVNDTPLLLRPGIISREAIEDIIGPIDISPAIAEQLPDDSRVQSPGMKYRHYAPNCPLYVVDGSSKAVLTYINHNATENTGILCFDGEENLFACGHVISLGDANDAHALSQHLFGALRQFDEKNTTQIYARICRSDGEFLGVYNRLLKASGFSRIEV